MKLNRRRWLVMLATAGPASLLLPGCAGLGGPTRIKLSESELNARVQRLFPLQRRLLEVVEASEAPRAAHTATATKIKHATMRCVICNPI